MAGPYGSAWLTYRDECIPFIVTNLTPVLGVLIIVMHSLPLHYRPEQSLNPLSQRPLTKQAGKACYTPLACQYILIRKAFLASAIIENVKLNASYLRIA
jgi:hypothetical protein